MNDLVVIKQFAEYVRGERITDPTTVADILSSDLRNYVVQVAAHDEPESIEGITT